MYEHMWQHVILLLVKDRGGVNVLCVLCNR